MLTLFREYEDVLAALQLVLAMLGMGATLLTTDFVGILQNRRAVMLVLVLQFLAAPFAAAAIGRWLPVPAEVVLGLLVLAVMPSGSMSNLFTHLGHGNLPLSITATVSSTLSCLVLIPWLLGFLAGPTLTGEITVPAGAVARDVILFLLLPMLAGMFIRQLAPQWSPAVSVWAVRASLIVLAAIALGSLGSGRIDVWEYGWSVPALLIGFLVVQFAVARAVTYLLHYSSDDGYTLGVEVALRNGNLAILFSSTLFTSASARADRLSAGILYVALFYGGAALVWAALMIIVQRRLPPWQRQRDVKACPRAVR